jgi:TetR/AcrR family fatty acid metabolism transcriptional regulator
MPNETGVKGRETRLRLLQSAEMEFALHGYQRAKISEIVKKAGLTQPAFYLYFSSKEMIYEEIVGQFRSAMTELMMNSRIEPGLQQMDISTRVVGVMESILSFLNNHHSRTQIGFLQGREAGEIKQEMTDILAGNLLYEQQMGYFRKDMEVDMLAQSLVGIIERLTVTQLLPGYKTPNELARQIVDLFLHGIVVK